METKITGNPWWSKCNKSKRTVKGGVEVLFAQSEDASFLCEDAPSSLVIELLGLASGRSEEEGTHRFRFVLL